MALIQCPECGRQVSDHAYACPECAYPLGFKTSPASRASASDGSANVIWKTGLSAVGRVALAAFLFIAGNEGAAEEAAIIGGLVIGASVIPTIIRGRLAWLRTNRPHVLTPPVDGRTTALDEHYRERIDQMEQAHGAQLTELEERLDFAERMLTQKNRGTQIP